MNESATEKIIALQEEVITLLRENMTLRKQCHDLEKEIERLKNVNQELQKKQDSRTDDTDGIKPIYPGRRKCDTLKAIRKKIAEANDIPFRTEECDYKGPCRGTCPKCDSEIKYLNDELQKKIDRGKEIILEGLGIEDIEAYHEVVSNLNLNDRFDVCGGLDTPISDISMGKDVVDNFGELRYINELGFSVRTQNSLKRAGINTVAELCEEFKEGFRRRNMSRKVLEEILEKMKELGVMITPNETEEY